LTLERVKNATNWSERFAKKATVAVHQHAEFLWKKRVFEEARESEYLLEKPLFAQALPNATSNITPRGR